MRWGLFAFVILLSSIPISVFADCSSQGYTIIYVNGILTSQADADKDVGALQYQLGNIFNAQGLTVRLGYNPTHLDGIGDEIESISQALGTSISDYDLDTILSQIGPEVTTRKLLLVGHSQGSFYTNEMYDYLIAHGVPRSSIAVYNLATPADRVAGGGAYLTSANDKLINQVRVWDAQANLPQPLTANILVPLQPGDDTDPYGGHYFQSDYLAGAGTRIVHDIENELTGLSANGGSETNACFDPPSLGLSYETQKAAFALTDPAAASVDSAASKTAAAIAAAYSSANSAFDTAIADAIFTIIPRPNVENAASAFAVEKALYGSSLSEADYEALLDGEDVPEVQVSQNASVQSSAPANLQTSAQPVQVEPEVVPTPKAQPVPPKAVPATSARMPSPIAISISPGFGGGSPPVASIASNVVAIDSAPSASSSSQTEPSAQTSSTTTESSPAVSPLVATTTLPFTVLAPADQYMFATSTISFSGTTSAQAIVFAAFGTTSASTNADQSGNWQFTLGLPAGTTTVSFSAIDSVGNTSPTSTRTIAVNVATSASSTEATSTPQTLPQVSCDQDPFAANGYFFDSSYQQVEYVGGLLRVHLKLLTPFNDGRPFRAKVFEIGSDCSVPPLDGFSPQDHPSTMITPHIQLYSFRMTSATHWVLWDDENDLQLHCTICEGNISTSTLFVSFYGIVDDFTSNPSRVRTTPYRPSE